LLFGPTLNDDFRVRIKLDGVASLPVEIDEESVLPQPPALQMFIQYALM